MVCSQCYPGQMTQWHLLSQWKLLLVTGWSPGNEHLILDIGYVHQGHVHLDSLLQYHLLCNAPRDMKSHGSSHFSVSPNHCPIQFPTHHSVSHLTALREKSVGEPSGIPAGISSEWAWNDSLFHGEGRYRGHPQIDLFLFFQISDSKDAWPSQQSGEDGSQRRTGQVDADLPAPSSSGSAYTSDNPISKDTQAVESFTNLLCKKLQCMVAMTMTTSALTSA